MSRRLGITLLLLLAPCPVRADDPPERLLPASTQFYLRWDGVEAHRASYEKSALGKTLQEDTGKFLAGVYHQIQENLGEQLTVPQLLSGVDPEKLKKIQDDVAEAPKLLPMFTRNGFILAGELRSVNPPQGQLVLILPGAAADPKPFLAAMRLAVTQPQFAEIKEVKTDAGTAYAISDEHQHLVWWADGKDAVIVYADGKPAASVARARAKTDRLADNPQFKKVQAHKQHETAARGFLDAAALVKLGKAQGKEVAKVIDDLGLGGLEGVRFYLGFEAPADRGLIEIDLPGPRKGILGSAGKPFTLRELPPLPADTVSFTASRINLMGLYDAGVLVAESVTSNFVPLARPLVPVALQKADDAVGFNIRKDLLASLGDLFVLYNSPTDGPVNLGVVALVRVKDEKKVKECLDKLVKALGPLTGADVKGRKRTYRGAELTEVTVKQQGFVFLPTYTVHKGWLAVSFYPQPLHGFVLRADNELPAWKPSAEIEASLDKLPKEFVAVSVSDPRPSVKQVLSVAPFIGAAIRAFTPESKFDVGAIPNGDQATRHLFPNVSVVTDDGNVLRVQSRTSLALPFDAVGVDSYFGALFFVTIARFIG